LEEAKNLQGMDKKLLNDILESVPEARADLPRKQRERPRERSVKISPKAQKFSENVLNSRNVWEQCIDDAEELKGLHQITVDVSREHAKVHNNVGYRISLNPSSSAKCMQYLENERLPEENFRASLTISRDDPYGNGEIVRDILRLRDEKTNILGHKTYAAFILKRRMAKNGLTALSFVENLHDRMLKNFPCDIEDLESFPADIYGISKTRLNPWEPSYVSQKIRQAKSIFNEEQRRPYFKLENVIAGLLARINGLYGIKALNNQYFLRPMRVPYHPKEKSPSGIKTWNISSPSKRMVIAWVDFIWIFIRANLNMLAEG
jgi:Zn-dependent oligopeptidase